MRIWKIKPSFLCRNHLLGEHREIHCVHVFITTPKGGSYKKHPEVLQWMRHIPALKRRHDAIANEITARGYNHASPFPFFPALYPLDPPEILSIPGQIDRLQFKGCNCNIGAMREYYDI